MLQFNTKNNIIFGYGSSIAGSNLVLYSVQLLKQLQTMLLQLVHRLVWGERNSFAVKGGVAYKKDSIAIGTGSWLMVMKVLLW